MRILDDATTFTKVNKTQLIQAVGVVKLDNETCLLRYYTDDDGFFQFALEGGMTENHVVDGKLYFFYDTVGVGSQSEWNRLIEEAISQPAYSINGTSFDRLWRTSGEHNPPVAMTEKTYSESGTSSETDQFVMLYERNANSNVIEYLMVSGEERLLGNNTDRCLVTSTGIDISLSDFTIIS